MIHSYQEVRLSARSTPGRYRGTSSHYPALVETHIAGSSLRTLTAQTSFKRTLRYTKTPVSVSLEYECEGPPDAGLEDGRSFMSSIAQAVSSSRYEDDYRSAITVDEAVFSLPAIDSLGDLPYPASSFRGASASSVADLTSPYPMASTRQQTVCRFVEPSPN